MSHGSLDPNARRWTWTGLLVVAVALGGCGDTGTLPAEAAEPAATAVDATGDASSPLEYPKWETVAPGENADYNQRANLVQRGHLVYNKYCVGCHGENGDGHGVAAVRLITQPRDFTSGVYKFRSTDSGSLPLESDLSRTIVRGLSRVSMPAFPLMPERDRLAVIEYIKAFYPDWDAEKHDRRLVPVPRPPADLGTAQRIDRGQVVYLQMGCGKCHGTDGRGTGATQTEYTDAWGNPQRAFDFTRGSLKGGNTAEDIYRTFHTGLRSIMPSFGGDTLAAVTADGFGDLAAQIGSQEAARLDALRDDFPVDGNAIYSVMSGDERLELARRNSWDLVAYILSLRQRKTTAAAVLGSSAE